MKPQKPRKLRRMSNELLFLVAGTLCFGLTLVSIALRTSPAPVEAAPILPPLDTQDAADVVTLEVPTRTILKGEKLSSVPFQQVKWPQSRAANHYVKTLSSAKDMVARENLPAMNPIPKSLIAIDLGPSNKIVQGIPSGMRAISVKVDTESMVEGWARPGSIVDIILTQKERNTGQILSKIIAENVKVLSSGASTNPNEILAPRYGEMATVTLLVTQDEALRIRTAKNMGKITFNLRGIGDALPASAKELSESKLLGNEKTKLPSTRKTLGYAKGPDGRLYELDSSGSWYINGAKTSIIGPNEISIDTKVNDG